MSAWGGTVRSNMPYCCSFISNSSMLPLHLANGWLLTNRSNLPSRCLDLCESLTWLGWGMPGECRGHLARDEFATSKTHSPMSSPLYKPWQTVQGHDFKTLAVACEFWSAFSAKRWQVTNKELNANGVYFGRVISNSGTVWLASLTNNCFNTNEAVREQGARGRHSLSWLCHRGKCRQIHSFSPWSVHSGTV